MRRARMTADTATLDLFMDSGQRVGGEPAAAPPAALAAAEVLALLRRWADAGLLRRLDCALAHFVHEHDALAPPCVLVAAALLVQMEGRGHSCLPLAELVNTPQAVLGWAAPDSAALQELWTQLPGALPAWLQALAACPLVRVLGQGIDQGQPLVLACEDGLPALLYLRRYWDHERRVASAIRQRSQDCAAGGMPGGQGIVDPVQARQWLDRFFPSAPETAAQGPQGGGCDWQKVACALALRGRMAVITGGPGTGKTYTAARLLALLWATAPDAGQLRVALAAPTGKAAARLKQAIDDALAGLQTQLVGALDLQTLVQRMGPARTLHALLGARPGTRHFSRHAGAPLDLDVLIVDEASMVHLEMMSALLDALAPTTRLVLLGDKDQLASVEAGAVMGELCRGADLGRYSAATARWVAQAAGETLPAQFLHGTTAFGASGPDEAGAQAVAAQSAVPAPALAQHSVMLRTSRRFAGPIGALANAVNQGDGTAALAVLQGQGGVAGADLARAASAVALAQGLPLAQVVELALHGRGGTASYAAYAQALGRWREVQGAMHVETQEAAGTPGSLAALPAGDAPDRPLAAGQFHAHWVREVLAAFERFRLLCAVREGDWGVAGLNRGVEQALERAGHIRRQGEWYAGRPVMVTRNDPGLGVFNGDIGIALPGAAPGHALRVYFPQGDQVRSVGVTRLAQVETAFAMTVHKAQGSEFEHTALVLSASAGPVLGRELVYTGITRARQAFTLLTERDGLLQQAIAQPTRRASGLEPLLAGVRRDPGH